MKDPRIMAAEEQLILDELMARRAVSKMDLPALPAELILGGDYVRRPAVVPAGAGSCALCQDCPHHVAGQPTRATGPSA